MSSKLVLLVTLAWPASTSASAQETSIAPGDDVPPAAPAEQLYAEPPPAPVSPFTLDIGPLPVEFHGYASQAYVRSSHNHYYNVESEGGSFHLTEVALNVSSQVTDRTRVVLQAAALMNDTSASPTMTLDFGFVDHRFSDAFGVRLGRFRQLQDLYSEIWDTDIARLPIFMPTSIYDPQGRQYFMNAQGVQFYGGVRSDDAGALDYAASIGALSPFNINGGDNDVDLAITGRVIYSPPIEGLRVGSSGLFAHSAIETRLDPIPTLNLIAAGQVPATFDGTIDSTMHHYIKWSAFAEYTHGGWTFAGEYARTYLHLTTDDPALAFLQPTTRAYSEGFYVQTSYRFTDHFTAGGYASFYFDDFRKRGSDDPALHSFDYAATFRFDLNAYFALKAEAHYIDGTAKLNAQLNDEGLDGSHDWLFALRASAAF